MSRILTISIDRTLASSNRGERSRRPRHKGEPGPAARPLRFTIGGRSFVAHADALPLRESSVDRVICRDVLEYVRNDEGLIREIARVLAPGGRVELRVPADGFLAGFDALNLFRYVVDITGRGARPHETFEIGWRRHYGEDDLKSEFGPDFRVTCSRRTRLGISEIVHTVAILAFRWIRPRRGRYRSALRCVRRLERVEDRIVTRKGALLEMTLEFVQQNEHAGT